LTIILAREPELALAPSDVNGVSVWYNGLSKKSVDRDKIKFLFAKIYLT
jgi:hypothetical protein